MSDYRTANRTVLWKVEATPGIDAAPDPANDAFRCEEPQWNGNLASLPTDEATGALDPEPDVPGGGGAAWQGTVLVRGQGTGGNAPEWGPGLRGVGTAQELIAADVTGTAQAGTANSITLAVGDGANVRIGQPITLTTGPGAGQTRAISAIAADVASVIPDWSTPPAGTTDYAAKACALYVPASSGNKLLTIYDYLHSSTAGVSSKLRNVIGAAGEVEFTLPAAGLVRAAFSFTGKFTEPVDVPKPAAPTFDAVRPAAFIGADFALNGASVKNPLMTFSFGNQVEADDDPTDPYGVDVGAIVRRGINGRINPPMALNSARNDWADFQAGAAVPLWARYGAPGNGLSFLFPNVVKRTPESDDNRGFAHQGLPFTAQGADSGVYIAVY